MVDLVFAPGLELDATPTGLSLHQFSSSHQKRPETSLLLATDWTNHPQSLGLQRASLPLKGARAVFYLMSTSAVLATRQQVLALIGG
jgi:hypothetical protein